MLSLIELKNKKVEAKRKKYDSDEMDAYLELVYENYNELLEANKKLESEKFELNKNVKKLSDGVQYYRSIETTLQKALILAEKTSKETKDAATLKADAIEKEAHQKANTIIQDASKQYNEIRNKCIKLVEEFENYKAKLKKATEEQNQLLASDSYNVTAPAEFNDEVLYQAPSVETPAPAVTVDEPEAISEVEKEPLYENVVKEPEVPIASTDETKVVESTPVAETTVEPVSTPATTLEDEILNADTIDLRTTLDAVKAVEDNKIEVEQETTPIQSTPIKAANVVEPVEAKVIAPTEISYKEAEKKAESTAAAEPISEISEDVINKVEEVKDESLDSMITEKPGTVPTLDSLLQDLNINNKSKQNSDDPFEFLGSVDDF